MQEQIINLLNKQYPLDHQQVAKRLKVVDADDFLVMMKALNQLEEDFIIAKDKFNRYLPFEHSNYRRGKLSVNTKGFGFLDLPDNSIFIAAHQLNTAMHGDEVLVLITGASDGQVVRVLKRAITQLVLEVQSKYNQINLVSYDERISDKISVTNLKDFNLVDGHKVLVSIIDYQPLRVKLEKILGHKNDPGIDILEVLINHDIISEFPQEVMEQVGQLPDEVQAEDLVNRISQLHLPTITIDGDDAKDLDDAISLTKLPEGYELYVHIADVSHYVTPDTPLDNEAYQRATSVYVVDRVVPMLPHALSNGLCSLNPRVIRLTLTCKMIFDRQGTMTNYQIYPSYIRTIERMTYNNVNRILNKEPGICSQYEHLGSLCYDMQELAALLRLQREQSGAIDFDRSEAKVIVDKNGQVLDIKLRERGEAERIIEDFMIKANQCVATCMSGLHIPSLYRVHEQPNLKKMMEFAKFTTNLGYPLKGSMAVVKPMVLQKILDQSKAEPEHQVISMMMLRSMSRARYDRQCLGHFGLALDEYLHFTSPIRRYPDLIVHRNLRKYYFSQRYDAELMQQDELLMESMALHTSNQERKATDAERQVEDMKKAEYMLKYVGQMVEGIISAVTKFGFFVEMPNTVEGLVHISTLKGHYDYDAGHFTLINRHTNRKFELGQKIKVLVKNVNKDKHAVDFELVDDIKRSKSKGEQTHGKNHHRQSASEPRVLPRRPARGRHRADRNRNQVNPPR